MQPKPYTRAEVGHLYAWIDRVHPLISARRLLSVENGEVPYNYQTWHHVKNMELKAIAALALDCGLRRAEIYGATIDDISHQNRFVVVRMGKSPISDEPRYREVPFTDKARSAIHRWLDGRLWFLATIASPDLPPHRSPWLVSNPLGQIAAYHVRPAIPGMPGPLGSPMPFGMFSSQFYFEWGLHRMRHTAATNWLRAGLPLEEVSKLLGHAGLQQTLGYARLDREDLWRHVVRVEAKFNELMGERT